MLKLQTVTGVVRIVQPGYSHSSVITSPYSYELSAVMRLTRLKKKILLTLLNRRAFTVEQLQRQIYSEKEVTLQERIKKAVKVLAEERKKYGDEYVDIMKMLFVDKMNRRKKDWWFPQATSVSVRRALESLRKHGLITKDSFYEFRGMFPRYNRWCPSLTEKGKELAEKIQHEVKEYVEEWFPFIGGAP